MNREIRVKTFILALNTFHSNVKLSKKFLNDKRLTQAEKKILECWFLLRDSAFQEILDILPAIKTSYDPLVTAQKNLIWGLTLNNKSEYHKAIPLIKEALEVIVEYPLKGVEFTAYYNLFIAYLNYKDKKGMKVCLDNMKTIPHKNARQVTAFLLSLFKYHSFCERIAMANEVLEELEIMKKEMSEPIIISYLITKYSFYSRCEKFDLCEEVLAEMKKYRKFHFSANFSYMRMMLDHLVHGKALYVYERDFIDHPFLYLQLKVIQKLEENDRGEALLFWQKLRNLAPHTYFPDFKYEGDKNIFSLNLGKYSSRFQPEKALPSQLPTNKEEALLFLLQNADLPIRKDELYSALWKTEALDKSDYSKLKMLIARVRQKHDLQIDFKKGCYTLVPTKKAA